MRWVHAGLVALATIGALAIPRWGVDPGVLADMSDMSGGALFDAAFRLPFLVFVAIRLPGMLVGRGLAVQSALVLVLCGVYAAYDAASLEEYRIGDVALVLHPGWGFRAGSTGLAILGGSAFLALSEWARAGGRIAGPPLLWVAATVGALPSAFAEVFRLVLQGEMSLVQVLLVGALLVAPVPVAGAVVAARGVSPSLRLDGAAVGPADVALLLLVQVGLTGNLLSKVIPICDPPFAAPILGLCFAPIYGLALTWRPGAVPVPGRTKIS